VLDSLSELLKLLKETKELDHNHPLITFLKQNNIKRGEVLVEVDDIIKIYGKKLSTKRTIKICKDLFEVVYIKAIPYFKLNKRYAPKQNKLHFFYAKKKFDRFLKQNDLNFGNIKINKDVFYNYYDTWIYTNNIREKLTKKEFNYLALKYLGYYINKDLTDYIQRGVVRKWRKRAKKEKTS
jgi:hypothetical protein